MNLTQAAGGALAAITIALAAVAPADSQAARPLANHVWVSSDRDVGSYRCPVSETLINNELDAAHDAAEAGRYDQVNEHLQAAAGIAAAAQQVNGCTVRWPAMA